MGTTIKQYTGGGATPVAYVILCRICVGHISVLVLSGRGSRSWRQKRET
jgi:hypothetical protein